MTVAAQTALGRLVVGDGMALLAGLPSGSVDLVFADPPYNAGRERWDTFPSEEAYLAWCDGWIAECARVLKPSGSIYVCGFSEVLADVKPLCSRRFPSLRWLVWHYRNKANLGRDWGRAHESVLHARNRCFTLDVDAARVPYNAHTLRYPEHPQAESSQYGGGGYRWRPHPGGAKPRDVLEIPTLCNGMREKSLHPTQKPLELVRRLVLASARPGELVVDPFAGAGTTLVVCEQSGRRWIGSELDEGYAQIAAERLARGEEREVDPRAAARRRSQRARLR